jgi:hypothetical protein
MDAAQITAALMSRRAETVKSAGPTVRHSLKRLGVADGAGEEPIASFVPRWTRFHDLPPAGRPTPPATAPAN